MAARRRPPPSRLLLSSSCLLIMLSPGRFAAAAEAGGEQSTVAGGSMNMVSGDFDFGSTALSASKGRAFAQSSRVNQNFLRRGTRADIERIYIERLLGRRGPDDWLLAGSDAWVERRTCVHRPPSACGRCSPSDSCACDCSKLDREAAELRERIAIADGSLSFFAFPVCVFFVGLSRHVVSFPLVFWTACLRNFNIEECERFARQHRQVVFAFCVSHPALFLIQWPAARPYSHRDGGPRLPDLLWAALPVHGKCMTCTRHLPLLAVSRPVF